MAALAASLDHHDNSGRPERQMVLEIDGPDGIVCLVSFVVSWRSHGGKWTLHGRTGLAIMVLKNHVDADPSTASSDKDAAVAATCTAAGQLAAADRRAVRSLEPIVESMERSHSRAITTSQPDPAFTKRSQDE